MCKEKMKSIITVNVVIIILLAHFLSPIEYNWKVNTISDLGELNNIIMLG